MTLKIPLSSMKVKGLGLKKADKVAHFSYSDHFLLFEMENWNLRTIILNLG